MSGVISEVSAVHRGDGGGPGVPHGAHVGLAHRHAVRPHGGGPAEGAGGGAVRWVGGVEDGNKQRKSKTEIGKTEILQVELLGNPPGRTDGQAD